MGSVNGAESRRQDRYGAQATGVDAACEAPGGVVIDGGCPLEGVTAGCDSPDASGTGGVADWSDEPEAVETVTAECDRDVVSP